MAKNSVETTRVNLWRSQQDTVKHYRRLLEPWNLVKDFPSGANLPWATWKCLNRLRTGEGRCKSKLQKWGYLPECANTLCECGTADQTMAHLLQCGLLPDPCTSEDLAEATDRGVKCS